MIWCNVTTRNFSQQTTIMINCHTYTCWSLVTKQNTNYLNQRNEKKSNTCQLCQVTRIYTKGVITRYMQVNPVKHQTNE